MFFGRFFCKINLTKQIFLNGQGYRFFLEVHLYDDLKQLLRRMLISKESVHCVLIGSPASGKTLFLLSIQKNMKNVFFIDATNASGPGIVDKLFTHPQTKMMKKIRICTNNSSYHPDDFPITFYFLAVQSDICRPSLMKDASF
jgi:hypothetical protein